MSKYFGQVVSLDTAIYTAPDNTRITLGDIVATVIDAANQAQAETEAEVVTYDEEVSTPTAEVVTDTVTPTAEPTLKIPADIVEKVQPEIATPKASTKKSTSKTVEKASEPDTE